ncbi:hypothetical protein AYM02_00495 [Coxiella burnetii]|uniref:Uncharacterized protein n=1 Tax=Coxiella burnetii (strain RSA 493 / Nine Mile phase I) TaxID=227377 RepID=B5QS79_COXBU|nr:hypothetical protein [Coxiella burnetii]YP_002332951.1 hypothetical protein CBU_0181a [Coxiella burnetii RSA 493]ACI15242.1 hypothetical protein CBU_0181a [Coxiella burnetii RSA 493]ACJ19087.1 hypothetical protein CbuG_1830 [Coxiella burnetii CbuG_Q212]AML47869.1 hypothetical protein AUR58_00785 [Coxiella burnetii]AML53897.1 hypothetical protein AYM38_00480 [Coxiella burnetii]ARI65094.1 hypothetical protein B7L74_00940 [Coxiella burnetii]
MIRYCSHYKWAIASRLVWPNVRQLLHGVTDFNDGGKEMKYRIKKMGLLFMSLVLMTTYLLAMTPHATSWENSTTTQWSASTESAF